MLTLTRPTKHWLPAALLLALLATLALILMPVGPVQAATPAEQLSTLAEHIDAAITALKAGDTASARASLARFNDGWIDAEDGIRALSRASYRGIEDAQGEAGLALDTEPVDVSAATWQLERLRAECDAFVLAYRDAIPSTRASAAASARGASAPTLASAVARLRSAIARLDANDPAGAKGEVDAFAREWTDVEGLVNARSGRVYADTENNTARARAALNQRPPDVPAARDTLAAMQRDLAPIVQAGGRYGAFDAAAILLREGLEALLVIGALLAFLKKSGNEDKRRWIWAGSGLALLASVLVVLGVNVIFARAAAGANRELLEGLTGLVAAGLLLYVSYWLHSKSSLGAWQRYVHERGTAALAGNSMLSLATLAFLAVFREGAETVLFYLGIAPSIDRTDLLLGLGIGTAGLVVLGVLILGLGVRLPLRPFFLVTSALIYYLAFKFVGSGVHALQVAGYAPATPQAFLPSNDLLGLYPTLETTIPQLLLLAVAIVILLRQRHAERAAHHAIVIVVLLLAASTAVVAAQGTIVPTDGRLGGDLTVTSRTSRAFALPGPTLSPEEKRLFATGDGAFEATFVAGAAPANSGLGPQFNNASCVGCHTGDGRGQPLVGGGARRSTALVRVSQATSETNQQPYLPGAPAPVPGLGTQIHDHATFGIQPDATVVLTWQPVPGAYPDGTPYELRRPDLTITLADGRPLPDTVMRSLRMAPPVFGRGLLEAVPDDMILALADPDDLNGDGISGRPNYVWDIPTSQPQLGRFGLKANVASLLQQSAQAYSEDMGITTPMFPAPDGSVEVDQATLDAVTFYLRTLAVPARRSPSPLAAQGEQQFVAAGCGSCHTPSLQTGASAVAALANQTVYPYSDLLLHDMGPDLADGRPDFEATGTEWRTPPLWGIGLTETVAGGPANFLHDGRARTLDEAILWHGGEAEAARAWFLNASPQARQALIAFLRSL